MAAMRASFNASSRSVLRLTLAHRQASSLVLQTSVLKPCWLRQVIDPAGWAASLHDDQVGRVIVKQ